MSITLPDIIEILFRHKFKLVLIPILVACATIAVLLFFPRTYRSEARLFLQVGRESMGVDPATSTGGPTVGLVQSNRDEEVKSAIQVAGSRGVIAKVVEALGPEYVLNGGDSVEASKTWISPVKSAISLAVNTLRSLDPIDPTERAVIEIEQNLKVDAERNSTVLAITLDSNAAVAAQKILEKLVEIYKSEHLRIHRNPNSNDFLAIQAKKLHEQWLKSKDELAKAKNKSGVVTIVGRRSNLETQLQSIELEVLKNSQERDNVEARMSAIESQLTKTDERQIGSRKSVPNNGADLMRDKLFQNQIRVQSLSSTLVEGHPRLVAAIRETEEAEKILSKETESRQENMDDINPIFQELKSERTRQQTLLSGLQAGGERLIRQKLELQKAMEGFNDCEIDIDRLEQEEQIARNKFSQYNSSLEEARMSEALEDSQISSISVAQEPTLSRKPVNPSKLLVLVAGCFVAFAGVLASILLSEKLDDRVRSETELAELTGVPVLSSIYESPSNKKLLLR